MGSRGANRRTTSANHRRRRLLISVALALLMVAAPPAVQGAAWAMMLAPGPGPIRIGPRVFLPKGRVGLIPKGNIDATPIGGGRVLGTTNPGNGPSGQPCRPGIRCLGNDPGGDHPRYPRHPIGTPVIVPNPVVVSTPSNGALTPTAKTQAVRRTGSGVPPQNERRYVPDEVVIELASTTTTQQADALLRRYRLARLQSVDFPLGGTTLYRWRITDRRSVPEVVRALETNATVLSVQPNYLFDLQDDGLPVPHEGDPAQYILDKMHLPQAHELARGDRVLVGVIDSGVDVNNPDLAGDIAGTYDALGGGAKPHMHGTAIAGAIAAHGRLMGAAPAAQILAVRAFSGEGADEGTSFAIMSGLSWAVFHGARVINMSFAGPPDPGIARSVAAAHDRGVVLIAAAGNKGAKSPPLYPAADPNVIAVTSTDASDQLPAFANRGRYVAVAAPGVDLMLLAPGGTLQFSSGTSFSAAYVTGTAALMLQLKPDLGPETLRQALAGTAHHLGANKAGDGQTGGGLVDAYAAVRSVEPASVDAANTVPAVMPAAVGH
jgi:hypothetical protein